MNFLVLSFSAKSRYYINEEVLSTYNSLSEIRVESEFKGVCHLAKDKIVVNPGNWNYLELKTGHLPMATMPHKIVERLLQL